MREVIAALFGSFDTHEASVVVTIFDGAGDAMRPKVQPPCCETILISGWTEENCEWVEWLTRRVVVFEMFVVP
jgi:hypothetical protein